MSKAGRGPRFLLDVNVFYALLFEGHAHHRLVTKWFNGSAKEWALCAFTEAGFLRNATAPREGQTTMAVATAVLKEMTEHPGYQYVPMATDWHTLCAPFFKRLYGTKQVTDAYLLGLAVREGMVLATLDKAMLHLAGAEHRASVLLLEEK